MRRERALVQKQLRACQLFGWENSPTKALCPIFKTVWLLFYGKNGTVAHCALTLDGAPLELQILEYFSCAEKRQNNPMCPVQFSPSFLLLSVSLCLSTTLETLTISAWGNNGECKHNFCWVWVTMRQSVLYFRYWARLYSHSIHMLCLLLWSIGLGSRSRSILILFLFICICSIEANIACE